MVRVHRVRSADARLVLVRRRLVPWVPVTPAKRALYLNLRRALKVRRRFDIEDGGVANDGAVRERQTCRTCGVTILHEMRHPTGEPIRVRIPSLKYRQGTGATGNAGICPTCTKNERDRRYPLS